MTIKKNYVLYANNTLLLDNNTLLLEYEVSVKVGNLELKDVRHNQVIIGDAVDD